MKLTVCLEIGNLHACFKPKVWGINSLTTKIIEHETNPMGEVDKEKYNLCWENFKGRSFTGKL